MHSKAFQPQKTVKWTVQVPKTNIKRSSKPDDCTHFTHASEMLIDIVKYVRASPTIDRDLTTISPRKGYNILTVQPFQKRCANGVQHEIFPVVCGSLPSLLTNSIGYHTYIQCPIFLKLMSPRWERTRALLLWAPVL